MGSQVTALQFSVDFSIVGKIKPGFQHCKGSGRLAGLSTTQVLALAHAARGGNTGVLTPHGITIPHLRTS